MSDPDLAQPAGLVALTIVLLGLALLVVAGAGVRTRPDQLRAALLGHRLLPTWAVYSTVVQSYERTILLAGCGGLVVALSGWVVGPAVLVAAAYAGFAAYQSVVLATRGRVPCGCFGGRGRVGPLGILRSVAMAGAGVVVSLSPPASRFVERAVAVCLVGVLTALTLALAELRTARGGDRPVHGDSLVRLDQPPPDYGPFTKP